MKFYKYNANGNDFIIYEDEGKKDRSELAKALCDRHSGIGADGLIAILPSDECDFEWDFYNCDGSRPLMCGNGSRAAAHFAVHYLKKPSKLCFLTEDGVIQAEVSKNTVEVLLSGVKNEKAPFEFENKTWQGCDTGVPHLVHFCENSHEFEKFDLKLCKTLRQKFNANVNYALILDPTHMRVRTFERGVENETLACGTGMAACFYLAHKNKLLQSKAKVWPKSDEMVSFRYENERLYFKAEVRCSFEASYNFS
ncbi:diaminopimelate epimerase [Campylobacter troglodytis]|uniref:diaminopimelate epimerase n=1 Tax=Campylobacter troglodytis TaxID=654363 RepID=UPI00115A0F76|nr:diaminopimelate epimerase [Campylobacter troglodytis]TQR61206.1 diaminopimelate epimerase [Campylobacter troglodytis]